MAKYLTVNQYKRAGLGVDLSAITTPSLAMAIAEAEAAVDAHMNFDPKIGGFEWHNVWMQERWNSRTLRTHLPDLLIPVRNIARYRIQVSNLSTSGAGFFATIQPGDCVINVFSEYVEIVPLQAVTYSLSPVILQLGLNPPIVQMDYAVGYTIPVLGDTLIDSGDHQTYYALIGFWAQTYDVALHIQPSTLPPVPPNVYVNGVLQSSSSYSINYTEGSVTFTSKQAASATVTADYTKTIPDYVVFATLTQTAHNLAEINLNRAGLTDSTAQLRSGDQEIRRPYGRSSLRAYQDVEHSPLCSVARSWLSHMEPIAIAG